MGLHLFFHHSGIFTDHLLTVLGRGAIKELGEGGAECYEAASGVFYGGEVFQAFDAGDTWGPGDEIRAGDDVSAESDCGVEAFAEGAREGGLQF